MRNMSQSLSSVRLHRATDHQSRNKECHMTAMSYEFLGYTIQPNVMRVLADQSPSPIHKIADWSVLKNGKRVPTPVFQTSPLAEEWIKQQTRNRRVSTDIDEMAMPST